MKSRRFYRLCPTIAFTATHHRVGESSHLRESLCCGVPVMCDVQGNTTMQDLPLRSDYHVDNEATIVLLRSVGISPERKEILENLPGAIANGWAVPFELVQDDSFNLRVVVGELSTQEQAEWVGKVQWHLLAPSNRLVLETGLEPNLTDEEAQALALEVPTGSYRVTLYAHLPGVNAWACLREAGHTESLGEWFRRTRGNEPMPDWLLVRLAEAPGEDPGHEHEWESFLLTDDFVEAQIRLRQNPPIDFLLHFDPLAPGAPCRNRKTRRPRPAAENARKPEKFPLGLIAKDIVLSERPALVWTPHAPKAAGLLDIVPGALDPIVGGPVRLRIDQLHSLARIPTWCNPMAWGVLLVENASELTPARLGVRQSYYLGVETTPSGLMISLKPKDKLSIPGNLRSVEKALYALPDGAILELVVGDHGGFEQAGDQRYRGELRKGVWSVSTAYPPIKADILEEAVAFAGCLDYGRIQGRDEADAEAILALLSRASELLKEMDTDHGRRIPPYYQEWYAAVRPSRNGSAITLGLRNDGELWNAARYVFAMRYGNTWQAWDWWDRMCPESRPI